MSPFDLLWIFLILVSLQPIVQRELLAARRRQSLPSLSRRRGGTVITLIHRQETMSLLGFPLVRYIDIDDAESILRAIRDTPSGRPIEIILPTPGGLVLAATQIAGALADHDGRVTAVVPHYAMSGGTLIALAADEIVMDALGPVDPQVGQYPAASILAALDRPGQREDQTLILADVARKAVAQVESVVRRLLERHMDPERAREAARLLATGVWTHDHPLQARAPGSRPAGSWPACAHRGSRRGAGAARPLPPAPGPAAGSEVRPRGARAPRPSPPTRATSVDPAAVRGLG